MGFVFGRESVGLKNILELEVCTEAIASVLDANCTTGPVPQCRTGWRVVGEAKKKHMVKRISCINTLTTH